MARPTKHQWAMAVALETSRRSTCLRRNVGCVLLDRRGRVLATGYNGVYKGAPHCNERVGGCYPNACTGACAESGTQLDACEAIHAEQNALLQCDDVDDIWTAVVTTSPCVTCTKLLLNTGCQEIVFIDEYPQPDAKRLWVGAGYTWTQQGCQ